MKRIFPAIIQVLLIGLLFSACKSDGTSMMKNVTGKAGELVIVIPRETMSGAPGELIREVLAQPQLSLPQNEPIFDLIDIPPQAFKDIFKSSRNLLLVRISPTTSKSGVEFQRDMWARPQAIVTINAQSQSEFAELFKSHSDRIVTFFLKAERDRLMSSYRRYHDRASHNTLLGEFDMKLYLPPGFRVAHQTDDFVWVRYETPDISQGILISTFRYESDSTFTKDFLLAKRDEFLKKNVPGSLPNSYMTTEHRVPSIFNITQHKGNYAAELRGLWRVEGDFMGGPFISLSVLDASKQRIVTVEGFVYAPRFDKRNYLRQVEAMVYSLEFPHQEMNDKITSQVNMGN